MRISEKKAKINVYGKIRLAVWAVWLCVALFCFYATPVLFRYSYAIRGYRAIGGEFLVPLIPFIFMPQFASLSDALCAAAKKLMEKRGSLYCAQKG